MKYAPPSQRLDTRPETTATDVLDLLDTKCRLFATRAALCIKKDGKWVELSYGELAARAREVAAYLIEFGLEQGDRVAILAESRPEWGITFFGAILAGAVVVPLDPKLGEAELASILADCAPRALFVSARHEAVGRKLHARVSSVQLLAVLDHSGVDAALPATDRLIPRELVRPLRSRRQEEVALIVYTSGTTGSPKGIMTTFGNLLFQVSRLERVLEIRAGDRFLSILPLNHLLELTAGFLGVLQAGGTVCYVSGLYPDEVVQCMREQHVTAMIGVPLFFRMLRTAIQRELRHVGTVHRAYFRSAMMLARAIPWRAARRTLFSPLHQRFGGKLRAFVSGGAPLDDEVALFFDRIGLPILQGYGLTETSPVISVNTLTARRIGSVGKPLEGIEVTICAEGARGEGEILTRGPHVMKGYYKRPDLTREAIDRDAWFHTGDLGRIDRQGFLYVTGRIKNLIVLGSGKKVQPEEVERVLSHASTVEEVCVVGLVSRDGMSAGTEEVCAVVVPTEALLRQWPGKWERVEQTIRHEVEQLARGLAPYKRPTRIFIHREDLPKTPARKVKRPLVLEWLKDQGA